MLKALLDLKEITGEEKHFYFIKNFLDYYVAKDGKIKTYNPFTFNLDNINEGRFLLSLYKETSQENYLVALKTLYRQLNYQLRIKPSNF